MERNFLLALGLSFLVLTVWTIYTAPPPPEPGSEAVEQAAVTEPAATGSTGAPADPPAPSEAPAPGTSAVPAPAAPVAPEAEAAPEREIRMETDLVRALFTSRGGGLLHWELKAYQDAYQDGEPDVELTAFDPTRTVALATPFGPLGYGDQSLAPYTVEQPDPDTIVFSRSHGGISVRKIYRLERGSYLLNLRIEIQNGSDRHVNPTFRVAWPSAGRESPDWMEHSLVVLQDGELEEHLLGSGGVPLQGFFGGSLEEEEQYLGDVDWAGASLRYFLAAIIPDVPRDARARVVPPSGGTPARMELELLEVQVPPGQMAAREFRIFLGPKEAELLEGVGAHLDQSIRKGWFPALTDFFTWSLNAMHSVIPNYGLAIIMITILVRLLMFPIMQKQMKSMKRMSAMQPKIKELQEKYADDKEKQSQEMMKVYRESGFNPLTGCLPMFLQLPVFIGLYYALQAAIQLRQEPFFAWISDLSVPETLFTVPGLDLPIRLLPLLMGGSMVLQARMTPTTMDPAQARMMNTFMPIMFTFMFYQFASGLVLYWLVSNLLGIGQQLLTNRSKD